MSKDPGRDRAIACRYNPTEVGQYMLHIKWSDVHVPGSPFPVNIVDTMQELEMLRSRPTPTFGNTIDRTMMMTGNYRDESVYGHGGSVFSGYGGGGGGRFTNDGMSTLSGDGLIFGDDN